LLPSQTEVLSGSIRSYGLGVPVISSNSGGLSEVNFEGICYLSDVGNTDEMAENALKILKTMRLLLKFKENVVCCKKFDIKIFSYVDLYQKAIKKYSKKNKF
jgi:glycosyltransferase involved in cell wall biosynthesis